jgi:AraC family transcriptional regulator
MLSALITHGLGEKSLFFPGKAIRLHSMIASCGYSKETKQTYDWHGLKRGKAEFALFQYCIGGSGKLRYEDTEFDVGPGQAMVLHFPHDNRYWLPIESKEWEFMYVCLYGAEVMRLWKELERCAGPLITLGKDALPINTASDIILSFVHGHGSSEFDSSRMAYQLVMQLADLFIKPVDIQASNSYRVSMDKTIDFCKKNLNRPMGVDEMAAEAGYSRYHFSRIFSLSEGMSPKEYLQSIRIRKAIGLLQSSQKSVKEISGACGFDDVNYFCRAFRKSVGLSPGEFRKSGMYREKLL